MQKAVVTCVILCTAACGTSHPGGDGDEEATASVAQALEVAPLPANADANLNSAVPFTNAGDITTFTVALTGPVSVQQGVVRFDQSAITAALGSNALYSARLDLTVDGISAGWLGGKLEALRMTRSWFEGSPTIGHGATWACADDSATAGLNNLVNNCTVPNGWGMVAADVRPFPFVSAATSRASVFTGGATIVSLDVTADVSRFLTSTPNHGWMVRGTGGPLSGQWVNFASRESANGPKLIIDRGPDHCPADPLKGIPGQCGCGVPDADANLDGVADCFESAVVATADTTLRLAIPFGNDGTGSFLGVTSASVAGLERSLVRVDQAAIDAARAGRRVTAAWLEVTVAGISLGWGGGLIDIHSMTRAWPEGNGLAGHGPSWFCADDTNTTTSGLGSNDCLPGDDWGMEPLAPAPLPFVTAPTDTRALVWPGTRSLRFNVTADVARFVDSGAPNNGWLIKARESLLSGQFVNFGSRESGAPPVLLLELEPIADDDCDSVPNHVETSLGLNPSNPADGEADPDGDGISTAEEVAARGNPFAADSNSDGVNDGEGLAYGRDFDGDGLDTEVDNCQNEVNPTQSDADGDGEGDHCDHTPTGPSSEQVGWASVSVARNPATNAYALLKPGSTTLSRTIGDQRGFVPSAESFRLLTTGLVNTRELEELVHPTTNGHAYVSDATERASLLALGFKSVEVLGAVSTSSRPFGSWVQLRRLVKGSGAARLEVFTTLAARVTQLVGQGYVEVASPGWVAPELGRVRKAKPVIRYRRSGDNASLHSLRGGGDVSLAGYGTDGVRFNVYPTPNGWTAPLYRLRNAAGREALASDAADLTALTAAGYAQDGLLGYLVTSSQADVVQPLAPLHRVTGPGLGYEHSISPQELATLNAAGYTQVTLLGYVAVPSAGASNPAACVGQPTVLERVTASTSGFTPEQRARALFAAKVTWCGVERALSGPATTPMETRIAASIAAGPAAFDPHVRAEVLRRAQEWRVVPPSMFGAYAPLDTGACNAPLDPGGGIFRALASSLSGGPNPLVVRAPHCEGGAGVDPRAITVVESINGASGEIDDITNYSVRPRLYGVKKGPAFALPAMGPLSVWADEHPNVGFPLIGMLTGTTCSPSSPCPAGLGQFCTAVNSSGNGVCRQYPVIPPDQAPVFTGASLWDPFGKVLFRRLGTTTDIPFDTVVNAIPGPLNEGLCDAEPVDQEPGMHVAPCTGALDPFCGLEPYEDRVESFGIENVSYNLTPGHFYQVRVRNENGDYFKYAETIPVEPGVRESTGRTLHVCTPDLCTPPPLGNAAACALNGPGCGSTAGGIWNTPPRPLSQCANPLDVSGNGLCPETPLFFESPTEVRGTPLLVYVQEPGAALFANTKIHSVKCDEESDIIGGDELVVTLISAGVGLPNAAAGSFGEVWSVDIEEDDRLASPLAVSIPLLASGGDRGGSADYVLNIVEDDDNNFLIGLVGVVGAIGAVAAGIAFPPAGVGVGVVAAGLIGMLASSNPDDPIGQSSWAASIDDLVTRGQLTHDLNRATPVAPLFQHSSFGQHKQGEPAVSSHPAVELFTYANNSDVPAISCANDAACGGGRKCFIGACVPGNWTDQTASPVAPVVSGHVEQHRFNGDGTDYKVYISNSISNQNAKLRQ